MKKAFGIQHSAFRRGMLSGAFLFLALPSSSQAAVFHPEQYTLGNGMTVVVASGALSNAVSHMVWYKVGAADDPAGKSGLAHYLEHLMFKGTAAYPAGAFSATIAAQGGSDNAFTGDDSTAYYVSIASDRLAQVMQMEAERMRGLQIAPEEAAPELSVVLSERQQRTDNSPQGLFEEKMRAALFPAHPYGRPVIGWRSDIESLTPADARRHYEKYYAPNNAILVVSGDVVPSEVLRLAAATFGRLPAGEKPERTRLPLPAAPSEKRVEMQDSRVRQPVWVWRFVAPSFSEDQQKALALDVLAEVLAGGEVGILYRQFVLEKQRASALDVSFDSSRRGPSLFAFAATPASGVSVRELEKEIENYLQSLSRKGLSAREVEAAKKRLEDGAVFARDNLMAPARILGEALAAGQKIEDVERWPLRVRAVTTAQVNDVFRDLLDSPRQSRGLLEPLGDAEATP